MHVYLEVNSVQGLLSGNVVGVQLQHFQRERSVKKPTVILVLVCGFVLENKSVCSKRWERPHHSCVLEHLLCEKKFLGSILMPRGRAGKAQWHSQAKLFPIWVDDRQPLTPPSAPTPPCLPHPRFRAL